MFRLSLVLLALLVREAPANTLGLAEVLDAVRENHPLLDAANTAIEKADAGVLAAEGAFDPRLSVEGGDVPAGYYQQTTIETDLRALTPFRGISPFVGWRFGRGAFADYDGKLETLGGGELRAGVTVPLLRGAGIDRPRADRAKAAIMKRVARAEVDQRTLDVMRDATVAYWEWVAAAHRIDVRRTQLALALERGRQIDGAIARGNRAPIDGIDNGRLVAAREALLVTAERDLRRASLELSLHLRDDSGTPLVVDPSRRPALPEFSDDVPFERDLEGAITRGLQQVPRLAELAARRDSIDVDVELAKNQMLPRLDLEATVARGLGSSDPTLVDRSETAIGVGATFELAIGMRSARGALASVRADRRRLLADQAFATDRIVVDIRAAHADLVAAHARTELAIRNADLAEQLAGAERTRFERGDSTVLLVNLREEAAADAAALAIDARAELMRARARFAVSLGDLPQ